MISETCNNFRLLFCFCFFGVLVFVCLLLVFFFTLNVVFQLEVLERNEYFNVAIICWLVGWLVGWVPLSKKIIHSSEDVQSQTLSFTINRFELIQATL